MKKMEIKEYACGCFYVQYGFDHCPNFGINGITEGESCYAMGCPYLRVNGKYLFELEGEEQFKP